MKNVIDGDRMPSSHRLLHTMTKSGAVFLTVLLAGCTQTNAALMDNSIHLARTCPDAVKLYSSPSKVGAEYEEVALLNSTGLSNWTTESGMMKSMREKASEVGATGVIMGNIDEAGAGAKVAAQVLGAYTERKGKSVAIYVPSDLARVASVCSGGRSDALAVASPTPERNAEPIRPVNTSRTGAAPRQTQRPSNPTPASVESFPASTSQATIGAPRSEDDREAARVAFIEGNAHLGNHEWAKAEQSFQQAILFDGSVAEYHAAMGSLMMLLHRWVDARASFSAAMLLDVDNPNYRRLLKEARSRQ